MLKHKADDDAAYRQQQQQAWQEQQSVHRPSTSHPTATSAAHHPPRPASVSAVHSSRGYSAVDTGTLYGGTDGFKWGGPTSGLDESLLLPACAPAPGRPHSSVGHNAEKGTDTASASGSARKPSPLGSPVPQQVRSRARRCVPVVLTSRSDRFSRDLGRTATTNRRCGRTQPLTFRVSCLTVAFR